MSEKEKMNAIDAIFDENNTENIVLYNADDEAVEFEQIAIVPIEENDYAILKPVVPLEGMSDDEAMVFELQENDEGERQLVMVQEEDVIDKVFDIYEKLFEEANKNN